MKIEVASFSKYRDGLRPGDDVPLVLPGHVVGVFDGATDAEGTMIGGVGAGRFAALSVAAATARLALTSDGRQLGTADLIGALSAALARDVQPGSCRIPPSTTLAFALDCGDDWRFVLLGDSGIRLNGTEVLRSTKLIDDVSTGARVRLFHHIRSRDDDLDRVEMAARRAIFLGLDQAVEEGVLDAGRAAGIMEETAEAAGLSDRLDLVRDFLRGGIRTQHRFANVEGHPLGFGTMNGTASDLRDVIDLSRPKSSITSIEIFTDGYPTLPDVPSASAWEQCFAASEAEDYHMIGPFATVKGSTSSEFHDDRTVVIVACCQVFGRS